MQVNTTGRAITETIDVAGTQLKLDIPATPRFSFLLQNLNFDFGDFLEIRGDFRIGGDGSFSGTNLEVFVGRGPSTINGATNPDAIGILITNASIEFKNVDGSGWAIKVTGSLALLGLQGLTVQGTVSFEVNTSSNPIDVATGVTIAANRFSLTATGVKFSVAGVFELGGSLAISREPDGTLDLQLGPAYVMVTVCGTNVVKLGGFGTFQISPVTGFRLQTFKVTGFELFPSDSSPLTPTSSAAAPQLFLTADLGTYVDNTGTAPVNKPLRNASITAGQLGRRIDVVFNPVNKLDIRPETITDTGAGDRLCRSTGRRCPSTVSRPQCRASPTPGATP